MSFKTLSNIISKCLPRNPLKRNFLIQRPTPAPPLLTPAEDRSLDVAVQRLMYVEDTIRKLMKEMKKYVEVINNLDKSDQRLSLNLTTCELIHMDDEFRSVVENYHSLTTQVGKNIPEMTNLLYKTFIDPLKKLRYEFNMIANVLIKREELVTNWKLIYNRHKKLQEKKDKSGNHIVKLEREHGLEETAAKELKILHNQLSTELPLFIDKRLEYIQPSINALIVSQLDYYGNTTQLFTQLMPMKKCNSSTIPSKENPEKVLTDQFTRIKNLTIVKND